MVDMAHRQVALVVEPDASLRSELSAKLRARGMVVDQAADGLGALFSLARRSPDLVVLDMDLPEVSGHRVFKVLRQDATTRRASVVMLADGDIREVCVGPAEGPLPDSFLQKPVTADAVLRELERTSPDTRKAA